MYGTIRLEPVTAQNVRQVCALRVAAQQERFVSSNAESLAEAQFHEHSWCRAVYADGDLVGFVMLYDDPTGKPVYSIWRLMIDVRFQRRGLGRRVVERVIEYVRSRPGASQLLVGAILEEGGPAPFYESVGFVPTGEIREDGEVRYRLTL